MLCRETIINLVNANMKILSNIKAISFQTAEVVNKLDENQNLTQSKRNFRPAFKYGGTNSSLSPTSRNKRFVTDEDGNFDPEEREEDFFRKNL
jgi:hypothetical protein